MLGLGVEPAEPDAPVVPGTPDGLADDEAGPVGAWDGEAVDAGADPDEVDALGWVGGVGANCLQAAMITRSLAGSALPPTPLRSTK